MLPFNTELIKKKKLNTKKHTSFSLHEPGLVVTPTIPGIGGCLLSRGICRAWGMPNVVAAKKQWWNLNAPIQAKIWILNLLFF